MAVDSRFKPSERFGALPVTIGSFVVYLATLCPTVYVGDSPEFSEASAVFGVPHPPGYPLYSFLSALFVRLAPLRDFGYRSNLFSAVCGGLTVGVFWTLIRRQKGSAPAATAAACCLAFGSTFWSQCVCAEVHSLNCLLLALSLLTTFMAADRPGVGTAALGGLVTGLLVGHRIQNLIYLPGVLLPLAITVRQSPARGRLVAAFAVAALSSTIVYAYLPIAASRDPSINMGAPVTWERFRYVASARPYFRHLAAAPLVVDLHRLLIFAASLPLEIGIAMVALPAGVVAWWRVPDRRVFLLCFAWIAFACCIFSAFYNVLDVASYFLPAVMAMIAVGSVAFDRLCSRRFFAPVLVGLAMVPLLVNFSHTSLRTNFFGRTYSDDLLRSAPASAILISFGDTATHLLWYRQHIDNQRSDITIVSADEISDWYLEILKRHHDQIDWPPTMDVSIQWISELIRRNVGNYPICMTQPVPLAPEGWSFIPTGLVFCLKPNAVPVDLADSLAFWSSTPLVRSPNQIIRADIHVKMAAFSYAVARFSLIRSLVQVGNVEAARSQATALLRSDPDQLETAIADALTSIDRHLAHRFDFGARILQLLQVSNWDPKSVLPLLEL